MVETTEEVAEEITVAAVGVKSINKGTSRMRGPLLLPS